MRFPPFFRTPVWCLLFAPFFAMASDWTPDPSLGNPAQHRRLYDIALRCAQAGFDPAANLIGEMSDKHPEASKTRHLIRESTYYAYGLLLTGKAEDRAIAEKILARVVAAQDTRPQSPWCGAYLWIAEDTWETAKNPDVNTAAFIGLALVDIVDLDRRKHCLDPDLRSRVEASCKLAVRAVIHRNVEAGYTNISLLSTALAAAGAKLFGMPDAALFAQSKLDTILCLADDGVCYEYLSPTYTAVALQGAYKSKKYAFSDTFAARADAMIESLWKQVAFSYHAPTFQLAGPHNRSYGDDMLTYAAGLKYFLYLALDGAYPLSDKEVHHPWDQIGLFTLAGMPVSVRPEFKLPVPAWRDFYAVAGGQSPERHLFQYREGNFILGTVEFQDEWKQKRNLVAYWRSDAPAPAKFRVGYCIDESNETLPNGFPYAQIHFYSQQQKGAALVALVDGTTLPATGACSLVFDKDATTQEGGKGPVIVKDGSVTAYIYPVSNDKNARFQTQPDGDVFRVSRDWSASDSFGSLHILSYLIVFRPAGQPSPRVTGLSLDAAGEVVTTKANVDGVPLSISFVN